MTPGHQRPPQQCLHLPGRHALRAVHVRLPASPLLHCRWPCAHAAGVLQIGWALPHDGVVVMGRCCLRSFTGFDACGHLSEETRAADNNAAWGIVLALCTSATCGFIYVLGLLFSIQACSQAPVEEARGSKSIPPQRLR